ncbi:Ethylmalonyl-CoA decarboxylase, partial [Lamprotornis superbus]
CVEPRKQVTGSPGVVLLIPSAVMWGQENRGCVASSDLEMALALWKNLFQTTKKRILQQRRLSLYNGAHGYEEELIKKKLQQFSGGSINLSKEDNGIGILTLNNPKLMNAFTGSMMVELQEKVTELENWKDGKGLIIHGAGNTFCSGSDLNADGMYMCMFMQNTLTRLTRLPLISVALVQGKAFGGGAELTTACDFRLMTPGSEIRFVHKHMGLVPGWGGGARLVRIVGSGAALQLLGGAVRVDPERALSLGLCEETLPSSDETRALGEARAWLSQYTEGPTTVIRAVKKVVTAGRELPLEAALRTEKDIFGTVWGGPANLQALLQSASKSQEPKAASQVLSPESTNVASQSEKKVKEKNFQRDKRQAVFLKIWLITFRILLNYKFCNKNKTDQERSQKTKLQGLDGKASEKAMKNVKILHLCLQPHPLPLVYLLLPGLHQHSSVSADQRMGIAEGGQTHPHCHCWHPIRSPQQRCQELAPYQKMMIHGLLLPLPCDSFQPYCLHLFATGQKSSLENCLHQVMALKGSQADHLVLVGASQKWMLEAAQLQPLESVCCLHHQQSFLVSATYKKPAISISVLFLPLEKASSSSLLPAILQRIKETYISLLCQLKLAPRITFHLNIHTMRYLLQIKFPCTMVHYCQIEIRTTTGLQKEPDLKTETSPARMAGPPSQDWLITGLFYSVVRYSVSASLQTNRKQIIPPLQSCPENELQRKNAKINKPIHTFSLLIVLAAFLFLHINLKAGVAIAMRRYAIGSDLQ